MIDLFADAPAFQPYLSAYLLGAYCGAVPQGGVLLAVVDPGVGTDRAAAGRARSTAAGMVGPDNGLFELLMRRAPHWSKPRRSTGGPSRLSASFHGRDLFAPVAAALARGRPVEGCRSPVERDRAFRDWPDDLPAAWSMSTATATRITGLRAAALAPEASSSRPAGARGAAGADLRRRAGGRGRSGTRTRTGWRRSRSIKGGRIACWGWRWGMRSKSLTETTIYGWKLTEQRQGQGGARCPRSRGSEVQFRR